MKFVIKTDSLKKWLSIVNHATATITTTPILENILLKVNYNSLVLTSNNLEMAIEYIISEDIEIASEWSFCVPSKLFTSYVSLINDDTLEVELLTDDSIKIKTETWKIKIKWLKAEEFPLIPSIKEDISMTLSSKILKKSIEKTLFSSAEWNIRPTLAWILVNISSDQISFATTDSFRLSEYKVIWNNNLVKNFSEIIPSKTASELKNILDNEDVKIISGENQIAFLFWHTKFYSRLLNWKFPNYEAFFPTTFGTKAEINRVDLMWALKKINLVSRENNYSIKISFSSENWILLESSETQIWEWDVKLVWAIEWIDNIIWINSVYLLEVLWVMETSHISISFESPLSQILITPLKDPEKSDNSSSFKHIIMPLKI